MLDISSGETCDRTPILKHGVKIPVSGIVFAIRIKVGQISVIGRNTQGVKLIGLQNGQRVTSIARVVEKDPV